MGRAQCIGVTRTPTAMAHGASTVGMSPCATPVALWVTVLAGWAEQCEEDRREQHEGKEGRDEVVHDSSGPKISRQMEPMTAMKNTTRRKYWML
jgi:hypothetical protein